MFPVLPLRTSTPRPVLARIEHRALHGAGAAALVSLFAEAHSPAMNEGTVRWRCVASTGS